MKKTKNNKILALDFDGVLWESARENWEVGYLAYKKFSKTLPYNKKTCAQFLDGRFLTRSADDFYFLFKLMDENPNISIKKVTRRKWESFKKKHGNLAEDFTEEFYWMRHHLRENDYKKWSAIQNPYHDILKEIKKAEKIFKMIYVASAKDIRSITLLLKAHGLDFSVLSREHSVHKHEQLEILKKRHNINYGDIYFIDDCIENLIPLLNSGINIFMAGWGYNSKQDQIKAKKLGIPVVELKDLIKQIKARGQAL